MIFGSPHVDGQAVHTHRDTYLIRGLSVFSVRRPFLPIGAMIALGLGGFGFAFGDLLRPAEHVAIVVTCGAALATGLVVGQLQLLSRDLRGSELTGAIFGTYRHLNRVRKEIFAVQRSMRREDR